MGLMLWSGTGAEAHVPKATVRDQVVARLTKPHSFSDCGRFKEMSSKIEKYNDSWLGVLEKNQRVYSETVSYLHDSFSFYFRPRSVDEAAVAEMGDQSRTVLMFVLFFMLVSVPLFGWLVWKKSNSKTDLEQSGLQELVKELVAVHNELNAAKEGLKGAEAMLTEQKERQVRYFKGQFRQLGRFYEKYRALPVSDKNRGSLPDNVSELLGAISSDEKACRRFEEELDFAYDGIMSRFRKDFPDLSKESYREVSYLMCGFDTVTLTYVLSVNSKDAVFMRKSRLRKMIRSSASPFKDEYLSLLK